MPLIQKKAKKFKFKKVETQSSKSQKCGLPQSVCRLQALFTNCYFRFLNNIFIYRIWQTLCGQIQTHFEDFVLNFFKIRAKFQTGKAKQNHI